MNYLIGFIFGLESSLLLLDQTFYWRSMITLSVFFVYALNGFNYRRLRRNIPNSLFFIFVLFLIYFYINYDFSFEPDIYSRWGLTQKIYYIFSTPILLAIFLLIMGGKDKKHLLEFIFSFSLTFAFLGFFLNIINFHGTENENFLAVRFLNLVPLLFLFFRSIFTKIFIFLMIFFIIEYFNSRTILAAILFFIFLYSIREIIFKSKKIFYLINFAACLTLSVFPVLFLLAFQEDTFLTSIFLSDEKGVDGRFLIWAEILLRISESPNLFIGNGSNHDTLYYESEFFGRNLSSHNMLLETIFRLGLLGYLFMILILFGLLNFCYQKKHIYSAQLAWITLICGMFLASLYEFILFDGSGILNNVIFWFTLATLFYNKDEAKNNSFSSKIFS